MYVLNKLLFVYALKNMHLNVYILNSDIIEQNVCVYETVNDMGSGRTESREGHDFETVLSLVKRLG